MNQAAATNATPINRTHPGTPRTTPRKVWIIAALAALAATPALGLGTWMAMHAVARPALPVAAVWRDSAVGNGLVLQVANQSGKHLTVILDARNPTTRERREFTLNLNPNVTSELGWVEGWRFSSGDRVAIPNSDFSTLSVTAP